MMLPIIVVIGVGVVLSTWAVLAVCMLSSRANRAEEARRAAGPEGINWTPGEPALENGLLVAWIAPRRRGRVGVE